MANALFIGLMSGTSLDGVDAVVVDLSHPQRPQIYDSYFVAYPSSLKAEILTLQHPSDNELEVTALLNNKLAHLYADAVKQLLRKSGIHADQIIAIGCHGQTIRHRPELGFTLQIGNAALLAELTGITVVTDFRNRDIAAGGQGAPLVPAFHKAVFSNGLKNRAIINIGGIANITYLGASGKIYGFDSGPGNMLLDAWINTHLNLDYDADGAWSNTGNIIEPLLNEMLKEAYFYLPPPKSTGRDLFNNTWLNQYLFNTDFQPNDIARTLVRLSAQTIVNALVHHCDHVDEVYLCGGGARNSLLRHELQKLLGKIELNTTDKLGIGVDWVEAIAFAWLARQCLSKETANLPEVTGARNARILGAVYFA